MQTVTKKAFDKTTGQEYEIEVPSTQDVRDALDEFDYPPAGIRYTDVAKKLANAFNLATEQRLAKNRHGQFVFYFHVLCQINALLRLGTLAKLSDGVVIRAAQVTGSVGKTIEPAGRGEEPRPSLRDDAGTESSDNETNSIPVNAIEENFRQVRKKLAAELLEQIKENSPRFFEELVIDLLVEMGYGGSREDAEAVGRSGDGGIDGIINEDRLGLDVIYVQAKRWEHNVGANPVRDFIGALQIRRARKGIFITTSKFSASAQKSVSSVDSRDSKVLLIDGDQLAQLMIDYDVGVSTVKTYEIKRVDSDYFLETDDSQTQNS